MLTCIGVKRRRKLFPADGRLLAASAAAMATSVSATASNDSTHTGVSDTARRTLARMVPSAARADTVAPAVAARPCQVPEGACTGAG
eukprot:XP_001689654.1 predicted protein [Chlamydomonas reinhardtii]